MCVGEVGKIIDGGRLVKMPIHFNLTAEYTEFQNTIYSLDLCLCLELPIIKSCFKSVAAKNMYSI